MKCIDCRVKEPDTECPMCKKGVCVNCAKAHNASCKAVALPTPKQKYKGQKKGGL